MRRVVVIGSGGSGKTTMAGALARRLGVPHVELDGLYWGPGWKGAGDSPQGEAKFRRQVEEATAGEGWVTDGNYGSVRDMLWARADTIVWLDYPLWFVLGRLLRRTVRRALTREELWGTNRESFRLSFLSRDSILLFVLKTHGRRRKQFAEILARGEMGHATVVRLRSPAAADEWLAGH